MKRIYRYICFVLVLLMLPLSACAPKAEPNLPELSPQNEEGLREDQPVTEGSNPKDDSEETPLFLSPKYCLAAAEIPERHPYPQEADFASYEDFDAAYELWSQDNFKRNEDIQTVQRATLDFSHRVTSTLLNAESGENAACSPTNLYMALAMLAEVTGGESREEILSLLGKGDVAALRTTADTLWETMYNDDGATACIPANALFLRQDGDFYKEQTVGTVAAQYHADLFRGEMGSKEYNGILQEWLDYQTRGLLEDQARSVETNDDTMMVLASTLYFSNKWGAQFDENDNFTAPFYGAKKETRASYMKRSATGAYYDGERFEAIATDFELGGSMWLIRPKSGENVSTVLDDKEYLQLAEQTDKSKFSYPVVHLSVPKFDITSTSDLTETLPKLGIRQVFEKDQADFSTLTDIPCYLSAARHDVRVTIDEEGCKAAAFTVLAADGAAAVKPKEIEFTLDHPFIFIIEYHGVILFAGVVQNV